MIFFFREKKLELRVAATGATDPEKKVQNDKTWQMFYYVIP